MNSVLLLIERQNKILSLLYRENRLIQANAYEKKQSLLESIYIGKIKNVVPGMEAAFVEFQPGVIGFLSLKSVNHPILTNRAFDGRFIAGDEIVVQVEQEGIKTKAPGLTGNLSFTGKYLVLTTGNQKTGFSNKLSSDQKKHWKQVLENTNIYETLEAEQVGLVVRTNAGSLTDTGIFLEEYNRLLEEKRKLLAEVKYRTCFSKLYQPPEAYLTQIRDLYDFSFEKIVTDNKEIYDKVTAFFPKQNNICFYQDTRISLEKLYRTESLLEEALGERVWLKSGGYLIIQPTEALTVIDVNSGKNQKKQTSEDYYFAINKEAAKEIALQLRLRNLSGIIVIDFINQKDADKEQELMRILNKLVKQDPVKTSVVDMTVLGLVEITRKKINKSLREQLM